MIFLVHTPATKQKEHHSLSMAELYIPQLIEVSPKSSESTNSYSELDCSNDEVDRVNSPQEVYLESERRDDAYVEKSVKPDHSSLLNCLGLKFDHYFDCFTCGNSSTVLQTAEKSLPKLSKYQETAHLCKQAFKMGIVPFIKSQPSLFKSFAAKERSWEEYYASRWNGELPLAPMSYGHDTEYRRRIRRNRKRNKFLSISASSYPLDLESDCKKGQIRNVSIVTPFNGHSE